MLYRQKTAYGAHQDHIKKLRRQLKSALKFNTHQRAEMERLGGPVPCPSTVKFPRTPSLPCSPSEERAYKEGLVARAEIVVRLLQERYRGVVRENRELWEWAGGVGWEEPPPVFIEPMC